MSGCWESNPVRAIPNRASYRWTTPRQTPILPHNRIVGLVFATNQSLKQDATHLNFCRSSCGSIKAAVFNALSTGSTNPGNIVNTNRLANSQWTRSHSRAATNITVTSLNSYRIINLFYPTTQTNYLTTGFNVNPSFPTATILPRSLLFFFAYLFISLRSFHLAPKPKLTPPSLLQG